MLAGLQLRLEREPSVRVVGVLNDPALLVEATDRLRPDVVVTEIEFEGEDVFALISRLSRQYSHTRSIVYSDRVKAGCVQAAIGAGAFGFISKADSPDELVRAVCEAPHAAERLLGSSVRELLAQAQPGDVSECEALSQLTPREIEVLCLIGRGMSRVDIAQAIDRSPKTVDAHRTSIMGKLGFKDRVQLARFAIREGIVRV